jgi:hypothetical protein
VTSQEQTSEIALPLGARRRPWPWGQAVLLTGLLLLFTGFILYPLLRASVANPKRKRLIQRGDPVVVVFAPEDVGIASG